MGDEGVEQVAFPSGKTDISKQGGLKSGPSGSVAMIPADPAFAMLAGAWPALTDEDRKAILAIVRRASKKAP